ncbi:hypothetical protein [Streptomyces sp. NPDC048157]|uniref:hypothetical protein n=1 Tax=Streptomyces sp. NPDC048157 TaxID=3365503 RepID=UPI003719BF9A
MSETPEAHASTGKGLKGALGKKIGPLPVGIWILAVGGGLIFAYYMRSNSSASDTGADETAPDTGGTGTGSWPYGVPNGVGQWNNGGDGQEDDDDKGTLPTTNEQWQRRAVQVLVGLGYEAVAVDRAIGAYLGGDSLTTIQRAIINEAILRIGPPPVSPPPPTSPDKPPPVVTPPTTKPPVVPPTPTFPTKPKPKPTPTPTPGNVYPKRWKSVVNGPNSSYSKISAKYKLNISGQALYDYQFSKEAGRPASTKATLKKRGPNLIYAAGTTVLPYPKR